MPRLWPISRLVWQIDRRCLGLPGGFGGWPIQWNHAKCCGTDPCCHGNEIWAKRGDPVDWLVCLFVTLLQIASPFLFLNGIEHRPVVMVVKTASVFLQLTKQNGYISCCAGSTPSPRQSVRGSSHQLVHRGRLTIAADLTTASVAALQPAGTQSRSAIAAAAAAATTTTTSTTCFHGRT